MLIRPPQTIDDTIIDLKEYNIAKARRKLMFFVDKLEYESGFCKTGKAIQINFSAEISPKNDIMRKFDIGTSNSTGVKSTVYTYNVFFPYTAGDLKSAQLILNNAYSTDEICDFDNKLVSKSELGIYNSMISSNEEKIASLNMNGCLFNMSTVLLPKYYTEEHQKKVENDTYSIIWVNDRIQYEAGDLIDNLTTIEVFDIKTWDTMLPFLMKDIQMKRENKNETNNVNFISDMFLPISESMIFGFSFIYDSVMGIGVRNPKGITDIPMGEFRVKENIAANLNLIKDMVAAEARVIEAQHGKIRLYYTPLLSGDKLLVYYDDYAKDNQPDFNKTKLDKDFSITEQAVDLVHQSTMMYTDDGEEY